MRPSINMPDARDSAPRTRYMPLLSVRGPAHVRARLRTGMCMGACMGMCMYGLAQVIIHARTDLRCHMRMRVPTCVVTRSLNDAVDWASARVHAFMLKCASGYAIPRAGAWVCAHARQVLIFGSTAGPAEVC